jgi:hypothetical protein
MKLTEALKARWVLWVWNHTPKCAEMARLASLSLEQPPTPKTRFKMWLHFLICVWCERYHKHLRSLHRAAPRLSDQVDVSARELSEEAKQRLRTRLKQAGGLKTE